VALVRVTRRAVLLDALGTLVELEPPTPRLVAELQARGVRAAEPAVRAALLAEISYYRGHHDEAGTRAGLEDLRRRCAAVVEEHLRTGLEPSEVLAALLASLRFSPYPEVPGVLRALRAGGARLIVVSNWDVSLHDVLAETRLAPLVDAVVTSAELGVAKPDARIFEHALRLAGVRAEAALHAGDSLEADVEGARAAGIEPLLVHRDGTPPPRGVRFVRTLDGLLDRSGRPAASRTL
jgi:putative hydrolase of the HAD superfamily